MEKKKKGPLPHAQTFKIHFFKCPSRILQTENGERRTESGTMARENPAIRKNNTRPMHPPSYFLRIIHRVTAPTFTPLLCFALLFFPFFLPSCCVLCFYPFPSFVRDNDNPTKRPTFLSPPRIASATATATSASAPFSFLSRSTSKS